MSFPDHWKALLGQYSSQNITPNSENTLEDDEDDDLEPRSCIAQVSGYR